MSIVVVDWETYFDPEYSLSKMSLEAYIRDPRFEVICGTAKVDNTPVQSFTGTMRDTEEWLHGLCDWEESTFVAQNAQFDGMIMTHHFKIKPKFYLDTQAMATILIGLSESVGLSNLSEYFKVGVKGDATKWAMGLRRVDFTPQQMTDYISYCAQDTLLTYKIAKKMIPMLPPVELDLINITTRMYCEPVFVLDKSLLTKHLQEVQNTKEELLLSVVEHIDKDITDLDVVKKLLMSNDKFAATLRHLGVEPPMKISPTTGEPAYAFAKTDEGMKELSEHEDLAVQALVAARLGNKSTIDETRTMKLIGVAERGPMPFPLKYSGAKVTHRWSGCLDGGSRITIQSEHGDIESVPMVMVRDTDLVWDGMEFVAHDGLVFSGYQEVIHHDGITGTPNHQVFIKENESCSLAEAKRTGTAILDKTEPCSRAMDIRGFEKETRVPE